MPNYVQLSTLRQHFHTDSGALANGYDVEAYKAGTSTPATLYADTSGTVLGVSFTLNARGEVPNDVYLDDSQSYDFKLLTDGGAVKWTHAAINPPTVAGTADRQWISQQTATYVSATSFTIPGQPQNQAGENIWQAGRRVRANGATTGWIYGTIDTATYSGGTDKTTVTVTWDSGSLSNEALTVWVSIQGVSPGLAIGQAYLPSAQEISSGAAITNFRFPVGHVNRYGAADGTDSTAAFITALSASKYVTAEPGETYTISSTLSAQENRQVIDLRWSDITFTGTSDTFFENNTGSRLNAVQLHLGFVDATQSDVKVIDITNFSFSRFQWSSITIRKANSVGLYGEGDGTGVSPYWNVIDGGTIQGANDNVTEPDQFGIQLAPASTGSLSGDGPNGNNFTLGLIIGVNIAIDVQSGNGNLFGLCQYENINSYLYRFNERPADFSGTATSGAVNSLTDTAKDFSSLVGGGTLKIVSGTGAGETVEIRTASGDTITTDRLFSVALDSTSQYEAYNAKAVGNKVLGIRNENNASSAIALFKPGATGNRIHFGHYTSMGAVTYEDETGSFSNKVGDDYMRVTFYKENIAASTTTTLEPIRTSFQGGIAVEESCFIEGIIVTANGHSAGSADVKVYVTGGLKLTYTDALTPDRLHVAALKDPDPDNTNNLLLTEDRLSVDVVTDGSWAGAGSADVHVTVLLRRKV